jgi:hypothetical protein
MKVEKVTCTLVNGMVQKTINTLMNFGYHRVPSHGLPVPLFYFTTNHLSAPSFQSLADNRNRCSNQAECFQRTQPVERLNLKTSAGPALELKTTARFKDPLAANKPYFCLLPSPFGDKCDNVVIVVTTYSVPQYNCGRHVQLWKARSIVEVSFQLWKALSDTQK